MKSENEWNSAKGDARLLLGDCVDVLPSLETDSVDVVLTDPPYAEVSRDYGRLSEKEWHELMDFVVEQTRRILVPSGSAVFVLQPNSERVGRVRPWLWEFMAEWSRRWNMVQDVWWWNVKTVPNAHVHRSVGLLRPSVKACVWLGDEKCYRDQSRVMLKSSDLEGAKRRAERVASSCYRPSGYTIDQQRFGRTEVERGCVTPFNLLPLPGVKSVEEFSGLRKHAARTPLSLCDWWIRYLCPANGTVLDPFMGVGTVGVGSIGLGAKFVGIEKEREYFELARGWCKQELKRRRSTLGFAQHVARTGFLR